MKNNKSIAIGSVKGFNQFGETGPEMVVAPDGKEYPCPITTGGKMPQIGYIDDLLSSNIFTPLGMPAHILRNEFAREMFAEKRQPIFPELKFINGDFVK
jgi:hypothetical protein